MMNHSRMRLCIVFALTIILSLFVSIGAAGAEETGCTGDACTVVQSVDVCPNVDDLQTDLPVGYYLDDQNLCQVIPPDVCQNIDGAQGSLPDGLIQDGANCIPAPVVDVCTNLDGAQSSLPDGYTLAGSVCTAPAPLDACPNLDGLQNAAPEGYVLTQGTCQFKEPQVVNDPPEAFEPVKPRPTRPVVKPETQKPIAPKPTKPVETATKAISITIEPKVYPVARPSAYSRPWSGYTIPTFFNLDRAQTDQLIHWRSAGIDPYMVLALSWGDRGLGEFGRHAKAMQSMSRLQTWRYLRNTIGLSLSESITVMQKRDLLAAMGLAALRDGLSNEDVRNGLIQMVLADENIVLNEASRGDVAAKIIDPRILVSLRYLRARYGQVEVSCFVTGHGIMTKSGNISLHSLGQAVDIARLGSVRITPEAQKPGGVVEKAVKDLVAMPETMGASEIISLWEVGGASFAMNDHADHIHLGFGNS